MRSGDLVVKDKYSVLKVESLINSLCRVSQLLLKCLVQFLLSENVSSHLQGSFAKQK